MNPSISWRAFPSLVALAIGALCFGATEAAAGPYVQTDLVSNLPGLATITDPALVNPWGIAHSATSPFWVSNQGTNTSTLYTVTDSTQVSKVNINPPAGNVAIPTTASGPQGPTGQVNNTNTAAFPVSVASGGDGGSAHFIFSNLNGTISAWDAGTTAHIQVTSPGETYTGLAINQAQTMLYAANDAGSGSVDIFNSSFARIGTFAGDPAASARGLVPFNAQDIGGTVYVTYAPAGRPAQQHAAPGQGVVAAFHEDGTFIGNLITGSQLAAPWGITFSPSTFGAFGGDLLVGNFSYDDSVINAFDPVTGAFLGTIPIDNGPGNTAGGLWAIGFGVGGSNGSPNTLYFADGINGEAAGLFGAINPASVPEPSALAAFASALAFLGGCRIGWRRRGRARKPV
ncbi:MAG TPA: TIGR03118 family protein [Stellaceae bacterium]|nr:TIGR03118 family protein [Stellaceae bacterium]